MGRCVAFYAGTAVLLYGGFTLLAGSPQTETFRKAEVLYQGTNYEESLKVLKTLPSPGGPDYCLEGQDYFMLGEYSKATDAFQKAVALEPNNSEYNHWLGRAWGRRAETGSPFTAPVSASRARQYFEKAVQLDPKNQEAINDLFDYYLQAPGFLGGGIDKARTLAERIAAIDPAEGHFAAAQIADKEKEFDAAEQQLRRAMELAPRQVGRVLDLARYLAKRGRVQESEAAFERAEKMAPGSPKVLYTRAKVYVEQKRNLPVAKSLLERYLRSNLTPEDPPRDEALRLLKQAQGA